MTRLPIIITAYNRPKALNQLLKCLSQAIYQTNEIDLHFVVDQSNDNAINNIAQGYNWEHGKKHIHLAEKKLGLKKNIEKAYSFLDDYEAAIFLEDDIIVSPYYYEYALQAYDFYQTESSISGISLYGYSITENGFNNFQFLHDQYSNYFIQLPSSWGQIVFQRLWKNFKKGNSFSEEQLPKYVRDWGDQSFKKELLKVLLGTNSYYVYPKVSLSSNTEARGTHSDTSGRFQVTMQLEQFSYDFSTLDKSINIYDAHFELERGLLKKLAPHLEQYDFENDLNDSKWEDLEDGQLVLRKAKSNNPIFSFSANLKPQIVNVINNAEGSSIQLNFKSKFFPEKVYREDSSVSNKLMVITLIEEADDISKEFYLSLKSQSTKNWEWTILFPASKRPQLEDWLVKENIDKSVSISYYSENKEKEELESIVKKMIPENCLLLSDRKPLFHDIIRRILQVFWNFKTVAILNISAEQNTSLHNLRYSKNLALNHSAFFEIISNSPLVLSRRILLKHIHAENFYSSLVDEGIETYIIKSDAAICKGGLNKIIKTKSDEIKANSSFKLKFLHWLWKQQVPYLSFLFPFMMDANIVLKYDKQNDCPYWDNSK